MKVGFSIQIKLNEKRRTVMNGGWNEKTRSGAGFKK